MYALMAITLQHSYHCVCHAPSLASTAHPPQSHHARPASKATLSTTTNAETHVHPATTKTHHACPAKLSARPAQHTPFVAHAIVGMCCTWVTAWVHAPMGMLMLIACAYSVVVTVRHVRWWTTVCPALMACTCTMGYAWIRALVSITRVGWCVLGVRLSAHSASPQPYANPAFQATSCSQFLPPASPATPYATPATSLSTASAKNATSVARPVSTPPPTAALALQAIYSIPYSPTIPYLGTPIYATVPVLLLCSRTQPLRNAWRHARLKHTN